MHRNMIINEEFQALGGIERLKNLYTMKENFCFFSKKILYLMSNTGFIG